MPPRKEKYRPGDEYDRARQVVHAIITGPGTIAAPVLLDAEPLPVPKFSEGVSGSELWETNIQAREAMVRLLALGCHNQTILASAVLLNAPIDYWKWLCREWAQVERDIAALDNALAFVQKVSDLMSDERVMRLYSFQPWSGVRRVRVDAALDELRDLKKSAETILPKLNADQVKRFEWYVASTILLEHLDARGATRTDAIAVINAVGQDRSLCPYGMKRELKLSTLREMQTRFIKTDYRDWPRATGWPIFDEMFSPKDMAEWLLAKVPPEWRDMLLSESATSDS
jgi:hypothetical protein